MKPVRKIMGSNERMEKGPDIYVNECQPPDMFNSVPQRNWNEAVLTDNLNRKNESAWHTRKYFHGSNPHQRIGLIIDEPVD